LTETISEAANMAAKTPEEKLALIKKDLAEVLDVEIIEQYVS